VTGKKKNNAEYFLKPRGFHALSIFFLSSLALVKHIFLVKTPRHDSASEEWVELRGKVEFINKEKVCIRYLMGSDHKL